MHDRGVPILAVAAAGALLALAACAPQGSVRTVAEGETGPAGTTPQAMPHITWEEWIQQQAPDLVHVPHLDSIPVTVRTDADLSVTVSGHPFRTDGVQQYLQGRLLQLLPEIWANRNIAKGDTVAGDLIYLEVDGRPVGLAPWASHEGRLVRIHVDVVRGKNGRRTVVVLGDYDRIASESALLDQAKKCCENDELVCGVNPACP